jgi:hypothetical protein
MQIQRVKPFAVFAGLVCVAAALGAACGSEIQGPGGTGASDPSSSSESTADTGSSSGGQGGSGAASTSSSGAGGAASCAGLFEAACLAAFPACAPVYDNSCCPTCAPGACADCINFDFYECRPRESVCPEPDCGVTPPWACEGGEATCPRIGPQGGAQECEATAGCVVAGCSPDVNCNERQCHAVTEGSCSASCDIPSPACPPAWTAEANGTCYTGFCIPAAVCGVF